MSRLVNYSRHARELGTATAAYWVVHSAIEKLRLQNLVSVAVSDLYFAEVANLSRGHRLPRSFSIRFAEAQDAPAVAAFYAKPAVTDERFQQGHRCILLWAEGEIQAAEWVAIGPSQYVTDRDALGCVFHISEGAGWLFGGLSKFGGAWGTLMRMLPSYLHNLQLTSIYFRIDHDNLKSLHSHRSLGYTPLGTIFHLRLAELSWTICKLGQEWHNLPLRLPELEIAAETA